MEYPEIRKLAQESLSKEDQIRLANDILNNLKEESSSDNAIDTSTEGGKRKADSLQFLKDNGMDKPEYIKMIKAVNFTADAIEIGGVRRAPKNLKAKDLGMNYTVDSKAKPADFFTAHVFQGEGTFAEEDYFTRGAIETIQKEGNIKLPTVTDMEKTLKALPGYSERGISKKGSTILSILLGAQMSGYRRAGKRVNRSEVGGLRSASPHLPNNRAFVFLRDSSKGLLDVNDREDAYPCRSLAT